MYKLRPVDMLKRAFVDVASWFAVPVAFLVVYVHHYAVPSYSVGPHLYLVLIALVGVSVVRLTLFRLLPTHRLACITTACLIAAVMGVMLVYYTLVLIGLESWAKVISWDLIASYAIQARGLMETTGISIYVTVALLATAYIAFAALTTLYLARFDWMSPVLADLSDWLLVLIVTAGISICSIAVYRFCAVPPVQLSEPLSLTFFPLAASTTLQGHSIDNMSAERRDRVEDHARSTYKAEDGVSRRNLILIVVDALRADHMDIYGYARSTTPYLSTVIAEGKAIAVRNVRSSCAESSCGLLSLASSKYIHQFSKRPFTLQQVLRRQGYRIEMILGGDHTNFYGLRSLYGEVDSFFDGSMANGYYINDDAFVIDRAERLSPWGGEPVMMQFHLMSSHVMGKRHDRFAKFLPTESYILSSSRKVENIGKLINFYDNGVLQADAYIHDLLEVLQAKGYLKEALVVITADHGEFLGEHGLFAHANGVRDPVLSIPLVFVPYGNAAVPVLRSKPAVSQADIAPTILRELGFAIPGTWAGTPLQSEEPCKYNYFQEGQAAGFVDCRKPDDVWKYWFDARSGKEFAYNLTRDPTENHNLIDRVDVQIKRQWRLQQVQLLPGLRRELLPGAHSSELGLESGN